MNFYRLRTKRSTPGWQVKTKSSQLYPWNSLPAAGWGNSLPPPPPPTPLFPLHLLPRGVPPPPSPPSQSDLHSRGREACRFALWYCCWSIARRAKEKAAQATNRPGFYVSQIQKQSMGITVKATNQFAPSGKQQYYVHSKTAYYNLFFFEFWENCFAKTFSLVCPFYDCTSVEDFIKLFDTTFEL